MGGEHHRHAGVGEFSHEIQHLSHQRWEDLLKTYDRKARLVDPEEKKQIYFQVAAVFESELNDSLRAVDAYNRVLELDPDYRWAVVGTPGRGLLWILARDRQMPAADYEHVLTLIERQGYERAKIVPVPQPAR